MTDLPSHLADAEPGSINHSLARLPLTGVQWWDCIGRVLFLPRTGLTVVPYILNGGGAGCVVVEAPEGSAYPRGGYDIQVSRDELERAVERVLAPVGEVIELDVDETPKAVCTRCSRFTWIAEVGEGCGMPQPDGSSCTGTFVAVAS